MLGRFLPVLLLVAFQGQPPVIASRDAKKHVGKMVTVCGVAMSATCEGPDDRMRIYVDTLRGDGVVAGIAGGQLGVLGPRFEDRVVMRQICATGTMRPKEKGRYLLTVDRPDDLRIVAAPPAQPAVLDPSAARPCDGGIEAPKKRSGPAPRYPEGLIARGIGGATLLDAVVLADGSVGEMALVHSSGVRELDVVAATAVQQWQWTPGTRNGKPVAVVMGIQITFTLH